MSAASFQNIKRCFVLRLIEYEYGKNTQTLRYKINGKLLQTHVVSFDAFGNEKETFHTNRGKTSIRIKNQFTFGNDKNYTAFTVYNNGKKAATKTRQISYYKD